MAQTFSAAVEAWALESNARLLAVFRTSAQMTFEQIVDEWPVDTGFSRASFTASLSGFAPLVEHHGGMPNVSDYVLAIGGAEIGDTIFANFTANYAIYIEYGANGRPGRGIVRMAAQRWQQTVNEAVAMVRAAA